ncbi:MAG: hypothetical protein HKN32_03440, partial [Flavobacteriales bacterium]|nr:hypothetical protein [Flavobacteriales bacterium]
LYHLKFPKQDLARHFGIDQTASRFSNYGCYDVFQDSQGNMWFGTISAGVFRYDGTQFLWIPEKELSVLDDGRVPGVRGIVEDQEGHFWLSNILHRYAITVSEEGETSYQKLDGISTLKGAEEISLPYFMSAVIDDETGDLWMLSYSEGIWQYDGERLTQHLLEQDGENVLLFTLCKDRAGTIWVGTHDHGAWKKVDGEFARYGL